MNYKNTKNEEKAKESFIEKLESFDCSSIKGKEKLDSLIRRIKAFENKEDIFVDDLEKFVVKASSKYCVDMQYIFHTNNEEGLFYSSFVINTKSHERICTVYGKDLNELFKKMSLVIYYEIKNGLVEKK